MKKIKSLNQKRFIYIDSSEKAKIESRPIKSNSILLDRNTKEFHKDGARRLQQKATEPFKKDQKLRRFALFLVAIFSAFRLIESFEKIHLGIDIELQILNIMIYTMSITGVCLIEAHIIGTKMLLIKQLDKI